MRTSDITKAYNILKVYDGTNPDILIWKNRVAASQLVLTEYQCEYILNNYDFQRYAVNKIVKISPELGGELNKKYDIGFNPTILKIYEVVGEMGGSYHCFAQWRQSVPPRYIYLKKRYILDALYIVDPSTIKVDFEEFDKITRPKNGRTLREHQKTGVQFLLANRKCILADTMGSGKSLCVNELIPTPNGFRRFGDLKVGDQVFGDDGLPHNVTGVFPQGKLDIYKITFSDGSYTHCSLDHLWAVKDKTTYHKHQDWKVLSLKEIITRGVRYNDPKVKNNYKFRIPVTKPVQFPKQEYFIDPYLLGVMIGDGSLCHSTPVISIPDSELETLHRITSILCKGYQLTSNRSGQCPRYSIVRKRNSQDEYDHVNNLYIKEIRELGLNVNGNLKFIPNKYKIGSYEQRLALLRGLMDSDGYISPTKNKISYCTTSKRLAEDVVELVQSLGGLAHIRITDRTKEDKSVEYYVLIQINICPFLLKHKVERYTVTPNQRKYLVKSIADIEKCDEQQECMCIKVDSENELFLTNNYIVTHNTITSIVAAMAANCQKILIITTNSLKGTWKRELLTYNQPEDIAIISANRKEYWDRRFTVVNYDIVKNFYEVPMEQAMETQKIEKADGTFDEIQVPAYVKDKKTGKYKPKMVKSRRKATIGECMAKSPLYQHKYDCVIIDEVHKLSNNGSIRYKVIEDFLRRSGVPYVFMLTGTPLTNKPLNLYHILRLIDAEITDNHQYYCMRYCDGRKITLKNGKEITLTGGATNLDELRERIKHLYIRRLLTDMPDMVKKTVSTREYELTDEQLVRYNQLWDDYVAAQQDKGREDSEQYRKLVEGTLVRQFLAKEMIPHTVELVKEIIEDGEKVVLMCCFQEEIDTFTKVFGKKCVKYDGRMSIVQKDAAEKAFMTDDKVKIFVGNIVAASVGLTLTIANKLIFNSFSYATTDNRQAEDRVWRLTQDKDVECIYQLFNDSISQRIFDIVVRKGLTMDTVIVSEKHKK